MISDLSYDVRSQCGTMVQPIFDGDAPSRGGHTIDMNLLTVPTRAGDPVDACDDHLDFVPLAHYSRTDSILLTHFSVSRLPSHINHERAKPIVTSAYVRGYIIPPNLSSQFLDFHPFVSRHLCFTLLPSSTSIIPLFCRDSLPCLYATRLCAV